MAHANFDSTSSDVRALPNLGPAGFSGGVNSAVLRYNGAPDTDPIFTAGTAIKPLVETDMRVSFHAYQNK